MKKPLGLLIITTSLFSGCDLVEQFIAENKDVFSKVAVQNASSSKNGVHREGVSNSSKFKLPQGVSSNDGIVLNQNNTSGWYKISGFAGGGTLKGTEGETDNSVSGASGFSGSSPLKGSVEEIYNFNLGFSEDTAVHGMSGQSGSSVIIDEEYDSNIVNFSYGPAYDGLSGQVIGLVSEEDFDIAINADDKRSKVKEYLKKLENELTDIKTKVSTEVSGYKSTIIDKIIDSVDKLVNATGDNISIGEISDSKTKASVISDRDSVQAIIDGVKTIIDIAKESGVDIKQGKVDDTPIIASSNITALAILNGGSGSRFNNGGAGIGSGSALAEEVDKADAWAMIDKIRNATIASSNISGKHFNNAGELITGYTSDDKGAGAKSNADLAAAVALKAMSKDGKFAAYKDANNNNEIAKVQESAVNAVKKVLSVLDAIITQTLQNELGKIKNK
ncbi:variable large family protein [Borrelia turicatae]|uniref:variable large family protein n=1 Tax=Borrelia turicatae TaxID=142 RepID=UPI002ED120C1